ncbi:hypothetical protein [Methylobacterium sp. GC_Met_2]|uniref:hypothetical protein n=1 Tax=Methylobacterium sp. GC_Met_2 TaxID=2937376 RepID=UPI00226B6AD2|nr:hypothetical protein [Methylobacterium sp. GC_Met_2]
MIDTYTDLAALAANDARYGRLWHCIAGDCWSFGACPTAGENRRVPAESVSHDRVRAALADGAWVASVVDTSVDPPRILAVQQRPALEATMNLFQAAQLSAADGV